MGFLGNIHRMASSIIPTTTIGFRKATTTTIDQYGQAIPGYLTDFTDIKAHVEPGLPSSFGSKNISESDYKDFGLDMTKRYYSIWTDNTSISTIANGDSCDQVKINNRIYNIVRVADWADFDGWKCCLCEEVMS